MSAARYAQLRLPDRPRLAPWLSIVSLGDNRLQLRSVESSHTFTHKLLIEVFRQIEKFLDGRHSVDEIVASVDMDVLPSTVVFVLKLLQGKGLLQPGGDAGLDEDQWGKWSKQLQFLSHFVPDSSNAHSVLATARVGVLGVGDVPQAIVSGMGSIGVGAVVPLAHMPTVRLENSEELANLDLIIVCGEFPSFGFFEAVNKALLVRGARWLRVCAAGISAQIGPTFIPFQTACHTCLDLRVRTHQLDADGYLAYRDQLETAGRRPDEGLISPFCAAVAGQAVLEAMRLLTGFAPPVTIGRFYELSARSPATIPHEVLRVPRCKSCGRQRTTPELWDRDYVAMTGG